MPRLLVDCDPGQDDAVALVVAANYGEIVGITTVGGNAPLRAVTNNALLTCQMFGITAEVHAGSERPLVAEPRHAPEIHGESGFKAASLPPLDREPASHEAVQYIIETVRAEEGLWLVALGPMTNIALALRQAPDLVDRVAGISFMGGSATIGNRTAVAEFNVMVDPEAAAMVLSSGAPVYMAGLDLTTQFVVDDRLVDDIEALAANGGSERKAQGALVLAELMRSYLDQMERVEGKRRGGLHDPCAVLAVTHPETIAHIARRVDVELAGRLTRGMTVVDRRSSPADGRAGRTDDPARPVNVYHGHKLDHQMARRLVLQAIGERS